MKINGSKGITMVGLTIVVIVIFTIAGIFINAVMQDGPLRRAQQTENIWTEGEQGEKEKIQQIVNDIGGNIVL